MDKQEFKRKLRALNINQVKLAQDLGITNQQVTNWNRKESYPSYLSIYFENICNKKELEDLRSKINNLFNKQEYEKSR